MVTIGLSSDLYHLPIKGRQHILNKLDFLENLYGNIIQLWEKGVTEKEVFKGLKAKLGIKEDPWIKYFCCGNVSIINGLRSAIQHYEEERKRAYSLSCSSFFFCIF